jgi:hypothetical protein
VVYFLFVGLAKGPRARLIRIKIGDGPIMVRRFQVIQGGKVDGDGSAGNGPRLFRAYSISSMTRGEVVYHGVKFNWYCLERSAPPFPAEALIADHEGMDEKTRTLFEKDVSRFLTEEEVEALRKYLAAMYGMTLVAEQIALPVTERSHLFGEGHSVVYDFLELSEREGYPIPIKIWGYYTLQDLLSSPAIEQGVRLLQLALEALDLGPAVPVSRLEWVLKTIYDREKLYVTQRRSPGSA